MIKRFNIFSFYLPVIYSNNIFKSWKKCSCEYLQYQNFKDVDTNKNNLHMLNIIYSESSLFI